MQAYVQELSRFTDDIVRHKQARITQEEERRQKEQLRKEEQLKRREMRRMTAH